MDCTTCDSLLLDLAYGELDASRADEVQRHAASCETCGPALRKLQSGRAWAGRYELPEAPKTSQALRAAIVSAATSNAAGLAAEQRASLPQIVPPASHSDSASDGPPVGRVLKMSWLERAGAFAMQRQVAMAAVFVMMIGVGLVFYQAHPRPSEVSDDRVPDVVPAVEVAAGSPADMAPARPSSAAPILAQAPAPSAPSAEPAFAQRGAAQGSLVARAVATPTAPAEAAREQTAWGTRDRAQSAGGSGAMPADDDIQSQRARAESEFAATRTAEVASAATARARGPGGSFNGLPAEEPAAAPAAPPPPAAAPVAPVHVDLMAQAQNNAPYADSPRQNAVERQNTVGNLAGASAARGQAVGNAQTAEDPTVLRLRRELDAAPEDAARAAAARRLAAALRLNGRAEEADLWARRAQMWEASALAQNQVAASANNVALRRAQQQPAAAAPVQNARPAQAAPAGRASPPATAVDSAGY